MLYVGLLFAALAEFGFPMGGGGSYPQWQGVPLTTGVFTFLGLLCSVSALTALAFIGCALRSPRPRTAWPARCSSY